MESIFIDEIKSSIVSSSDKINPSIFNFKSTILKLKTPDLDLILFSSYFLKTSYT